MSRFSKDLFGGVKGKTELKTSLPFKLDKERAIKDIENSIRAWNKQKKNKSNILKKLISRFSNNSFNDIHWEFSDIKKEHVNVHLIWSEKRIRTANEVKKKDVLKALKSLKNFYKKISSIKPDISHPDILQCYNVTAKKNGLEIIKNTFINQIEVNEVDPFGNSLYKKSKFLINNIESDKRNALKHVNRSIESFKKIGNGISISNFKKAGKYIALSSKSSSHFDIFFIWADAEIKQIKNIKKEHVMKALISLRIFIENLDSQSPNIQDPIIKKMYNLSKIKHRPKNKCVEFLARSEGGHSYWSYRQHRWIIGKIDKKTKMFIAPKKNL